MKELSIEEKAKAYDEALKVLHKYDGVNIMFSQSLKEEMFPELAESEDERIRKELLEHCINRIDGKQVCVDASDYRRWADWLFRIDKENTSNVKSGEVIRNEIIKFLELPHPQFVGKRHQEEWISWLEKQGQVKESLISQHENKTCKEIDDSLTSQDEKIRKDCIKYLDWEYQHCPFDKDKMKIEKCIAWLEKQGEQKPQGKSALEAANEEKVDNKNCIKSYAQEHIGDKVEPKFKVGDYIERKDGLGCHAKIIFVGGNVYGCEKLIYPEDSSPFFEFMFKNQDEFQISSDFKQKPAWSEEDEKELDRVIYMMEQLDLTQSWSDCYTFLNSLKDRILPQPVQKWNEEDDSFRIQCLDLIAHFPSPTGKINWTGCQNWLEFLKDRYTWRPSEEQIHALSAINITGNISYEGQKRELINLYNDLKKLKG